MTRIDFAGSNEWYIKKDGPASYWLCHQTEDDELDDHHTNCTRIDYILFKEFIGFRSRRSAVMQQMSQARIGVANPDAPIVE